MVFSLRRVMRVVRKELIQAFRDPTMRSLLFVPPLLQLVLFGYAVNTDVRNIETAVLDQDGTPASRALVARLEGSTCFRIVRRAADEREVRRLLDRGEVLAALHVRAGFSERRARGLPTRVQLLLDGTDSNTATVALAYARQALAPAAVDPVGLPLRGEPVELKPRVWFNQSLRSRIYFIPGVIALIALLVSLMLTSMSVVREREMGTLEQLLVTPLRPLELVLGKSIPFGMVVAVDILFVTVAAILLFDLPVRGSIVLLSLSLLLFVVSSLGIGLLISTASHTQQQAMMLSFVMMFPITLLSGFAFPIRNMPEIIRYATGANPMRHILVILRAVLLKGVGLDVLYPQVLALLGLTVLIMAAAVLRFRQRME